MHRVWLLFNALAFVVMVNAQTHRVTFAEPARLVAYASGVALEWKTFDEADVDYFAVLRRSGGLERTIATLVPKGGSSNAGMIASSYRYIDPTPFTSDLAFSMRVVFHDGAYADTDWLSAASANDSRMRVLSALDEESLARLHIKLEVDDAQEVVVRVKTLRGEPLDTYVRELAAGSNTIEIDYGNWPSGYYTVVVDDAHANMEWLVHVDGIAGKASTRRIPKS